MNAVTVTDLSALVLGVFYLYTPVRGKADAVFAKPIGLALPVVALSAFVLIAFSNYLLVDRLADWDLDAYLYLGSRLDQGELIFTKDFETKLPLVQYLFWLPYKLGGLGTWRIMTFVASMASGYFATKWILALLFPGAPLSEAQAKPVVAVTVCLYMLFLYYLPGANIGHISMVAGDALFLVTAMLAKSFFGRAYSAKLPTAAGMLFAVAVSIRPHYLFTVPALLLPPLFTETGRPLTDRVNGIVKISVAFGAGAAFVMFGQFVPYLFNAAALSSLAQVPHLFSQFSTGSLLSQIVSDQFSSGDTHCMLLVVLLSAAIVSGYAIVSYKRRAPDADFQRLMFFGSLSIASLLLLYVSFVSTHYYNHYPLMFAPFMAILVLCLIAVLTTGNARFRTPEAMPFAMRLRNCLIMAGICAAVLYSHLAWFLFTNLRQEYAAVSFAINDRDPDPSMKALLQTLMDRNLTFYLPDDIAYHWYFKKLRLGDAHPIMPHLVLSGTRIGPIGDLYMFSEAAHENPCSILTASNVDVITARKLSTDIVNCLAAPGSHYDQMTGSAVSAALGVPLTPLVLDNYLFFAKQK